MAPTETPRRARLRYVLNQWVGYVVSSALFLLTLWWVPFLHGEREVMRTTAISVPFTLALLDWWWYPARQRADHDRRPDDASAPESPEEPSVPS